MSKSKSKNQLEIEREFSSMSMNVAGPEPGEPTYPCKVCGRKFVKPTLAKHEPACKKLQTKKRKVFDTGKQRAVGSDIPLASIRKVQKEIEKNDGKFQPPRTHWKEKHEQFVSAVRTAKGVDHALKTGSPLPPPPKSTVPSDYVKCDYCGRNFNSSAAERHIPYCREKSKQNSKVPPPTKAVQARKPVVMNGRPTGDKSETQTRPSPSLKPEASNKQQQNRGKSPARSANGTSRIPGGASRR